MQAIQSIDLITINPAVRNGRPCIIDTGIRVTDIVMAHLYHDRSPGDIAADYDLSMSRVYAALSYYYAHKAELDADIREQLRTARALKEANAGGQSDSLLPG